MELDSLAQAGVNLFAVNTSGDAGKRQHYYTSLRYSTVKITSHTHAHMHFL
jgi:hypothetical protein